MKTVGHENTAHVHFSTSVTANAIW